MLVPPAVTARVAHHVAALHAWNAAIAQARRMEAVAHQPGRYEYDLAHTAAGATLRAQVTQAHTALAALEAQATALGVPLAVLYAPWDGKPALLLEGAAVGLWQGEECP